MSANKPTPETHTTERLPQGAAPRVSIITPCYNARPYLPATWRSIKRQTFTNWEWVVSDDGSTDGSREWLEKLAARDPRVRLIDGPRASRPSVPRNRSMHASRGEFLAFLDADDLWRPEKLQRQIDMMDGDPEALLCWAWPREFWSPELGRSTTPPRVWPRIDFPRIAGPHVLSTGIIPMPSSLLFRRTLLETVGYFDEDIRLNFNEDYEWILRATHAGPLLRAPGLLVGYRMHGSNLTHRASWHSLVALLEKVQALGYVEGRAGRSFLSNTHLRLAESYLIDPESPSPRPHFLQSWLNKPLDPRRIIPLVVLPLPRSWMLPVYSSLKRLQAMLSRQPIAHQLAGRQWRKSEES